MEAARPSPPLPVRLPVLDALRGIAALLVLGYHVEGGVGRGHLFARGYLAVDLFFLLSGFVLALAFDDRFAGGLGARRFMRQRCRRLWPTMALAMALGTAVALLRNPGWPLLAVALRNLLFIPASCGSDALYCTNGPAWSLACELLANLLHALVLWRLGDRALLAVAAAAGMALAAAILGGGNGGPGANLGVDWQTAGGGLLRAAFAYPLGMWLARRWRRAAPGTLPACLGLAPGPLLIVALGMADGGQRAMADALACLVALPACFWLATRARRDMGAAWGRWLGALSYPLYAVHEPVLKLAIVLAPMFAAGRSAGLAALVAAAAVALAAMIRPIAGGQRARAELKVYGLPART